MAVQSKQVGFIGLGNIGQPMAITLARTGFDVHVYDVRAESVEECVAAGARAAATPSDVGAECDIVGVAVLNDAQVTEVVTGADGVLAAARPDTIIVVHSTVLPGTVTALARQVAADGFSIVDAPVSGGDMGAQTGTLTIMAGGSESALERCRPYLRAIGEHIDIVGETGAGAAAKLALQLMTYANQLAALESVRLADAHGIDENRLIDLATTTTADSWIIRNWGFFDRLLREHRSAGSDEVYQNYGKDLFDVIVAARETGVSLPIAGAAAQALRPLFQDRYESVSRD